MKLLQKIDQRRRDFDGHMICQSCNTEETVKNCYDDDYFHDNVIPAIKCKVCEKSTLDLQLPNERMGTKYLPNEII